MKVRILHWKSISFSGISIPGHFNGLKLPNVLGALVTLLLNAFHTWKGSIEDRDQTPGPSSQRLEGLSPLKNGMKVAEQRALRVYHSGRAAEKMPISDTLSVKKPEGLRVHLRLE